MKPQETVKGVRSSSNGPEDGPTGNAAWYADTGASSMVRRLGSFRGLMLIGMGLRALWAAIVPVEPVSDSWAYHQLARNMVDYGNYGWTADVPTAYWAVGTSAIAAFTYLLTDGFAGIVILNLIAGAMIMVLTYQLAARWFDQTIATLALAFVAFWPNLIFFTTILSSELYFIAMTLAGLFFWQRPVGNQAINLLLAGLIWGLTCYIRPVILLVPVTLFLADLPKGPRRIARTALEAWVTVMLILLVALPWTMRNNRIFGEPVVISTNFGPNLWMGNNPESNGGYMDLPDAIDGMSEVERSDYLKAEVARFVREDPGAALRLLGVKLVRLNIRETIGVAWNEKPLLALVGDRGVLVAKLIATTYWYVVFIGALAGIAIMARRNGVVTAFFNPPVALWGYFTTLHVVVVADDRYHMPSTPCIAMLAAVTFHAIYLRGQRARGRMLHDGTF